MKNFYSSLIILLCSVSLKAQLVAPEAVSTSSLINWGAYTKSAADTCGTYYNNYIGLGKTSLVRIERLRVGNATESNNYNGRAQKFNAPQPIEISGVEFYCFIDNNPLVDSLMVITTLNQFDATGNTLGAELARDTVYVFHDNFDPLVDPLPSISVQSEFDTPITVSSDYMVGLYTPTDDSLRIIANGLSVNDGAGEGLSYALYDNPNFASFIGWYDMLTDFSADYDFLISPRVAYKIRNGFELSDTIACLNTIDHTCADYNQVPAFLNKQYNSNFANALGSISIDWDDNSSDLGIDSICHTYAAAGFYGVKIADTLHRWDFASPTCVVNLTDSILVNSPSLVTVIDTACESYIGPNGQTWTTSGTYIDTLINSVGCDSIITSEIVIKNSSFATITDFGCGSYTSPSGQLWTSSGTYMDTIPNSVSCDSVMTFNITITPLLTTTVMDTSCFQYVSPTGQVWVNSGIYIDTIQSSNSCDSIIITYDIIIQDSIEIDFTFTQTLLDISFTAITNNVDSVWWDFGDNSTGSSLLNPTHTYPGPGTYNVWLYSFNKCMTKAKFTTITISPSSILDNTGIDLSIYPNPANQNITISGLEANTIIKIYNIAGKLEFTSKSNQIKQNIFVGDLANGTYFVNIRNGDLEMTRKITIKH